MKGKKILLGIILGLIGLVGVLSILTMEIPLPEEALAVLSAQFSPQQIKLITLINPTIMLFGAVFIGIAFYKKVDFKLPFFERIVGLNKEALDFKSLLVSGSLFGILSGVLIVLSSNVSSSFLPQEFLELSQDIKPSILSRFLYGGFTEEILTRFGLMTFVVWFLYEITKKKENWMYWIGILVAAVLFAAGHLPLVFQSLSDPSIGVISYVLIGNSIGGVIFGWLYWKKGLESAILAHIVTHVVMLVVEMIL